jgi:hypothetical protein
MFDQMSLYDRRIGQDGREATRGILTRTAGTRAKRRPRKSHHPRGDKNYLPVREGCSMFGEGVISLLPL